MTRLASGRSQQDVALASKISQSQLARIEHGQNRTVAVEVLTIVAAVVGLDVRLLTYPGGRILRDAGQTRVLRSFRDRLGDQWIWRYEVRVGTTGQRAWDAQARHARTGFAFVVEAETRINDVQALLRRVALKREVTGVRVILLVAGTHHNRAAIEEAAPFLKAEFPCGVRRCLAALGAGTDPGADAMVIVDPPRRRDSTRRPPEAPPDPRPPDGARWSQTAGRSESTRSTDDRAGGDRFGRRW